MPAVVMSTKAAAQVGAKTATRQSRPWERVLIAQREAHRLYVLSLNVRSPEEHAQAIREVQRGLEVMQQAQRAERADMAACGFVIRQAVP